MGGGKGALSRGIFFQDFVLREDVSGGWGGISLGRIVPKKNTQGICLATAIFYTSRGRFTTLLMGVQEGANGCGRGP